MQPTHLKPIGLGVLAGVLFLAGFRVGSLGVLFFFLPTLALFTVGFTEGEKPTRIAVLTAMLVTVVGGLSSLLQFVLVHGVPVLFFVRYALLWRARDDRHKEWYPLGNILLGLSLYFAVLSLLFLAFSDQTEVARDLVEKQIPAEIEKLSPEDQAVIKEANISADALLYILAALANWVWVMMIYAMAVVASLQMVNKKLRPSMRLEQFRIPLWMLVLIGGCAIVSVVGEGAVRYLVGMLLITLLLPYFLSGLIVLHDALRGNTWRVFFLILLYLVLLPMGWPVGLVIMIGMAYQSNLLRFKLKEK